MHDLRGVVDVLDGVLGLRLLGDGGCGNTLGLRELVHDVGFDELVVRGGSGHDDVRGDAGFVLADGFEDALALLG